MSQRFVKGYTNNHLTWVMVDATDFATPESALSAAAKIKIYGKLKSATGVNFVSSGTGSLTNDIQHVGASALGIYTIALAKADLSDASAAWYDQYVISISATGAAYQTLVVDGGIIESYLSAAVSDALSAAVALSDAVSNVYSAVILTESFASDAASAAQQANSRVLLGNSMISDVDSALNSQFAVTSNYLSNASNYLSDILSTMGSMFAVESNYLSYISGVVSGLGAGASASAVAAAVWSDFTSKAGASPSQLYSVVLIGASAASDAASAAQQANSRVLLGNSMISDVDSALSSQFVATSAFLSDIDSAVSSQFVALSAIISDAHSAAVLAGSYASDVYSALTANRAEPAQGAPAASTTALAKLDYLYKAWRNRTTQTATEYALYADDATTVDHKAAFSDDGTTADRAEVATGP